MDFVSALPVLKPLSEAAQYVVLLGAAIAALGVIHLKVIRPTRAFIKRLNRGVEILLSMENVQQRLDSLEQAVEALRERMKRVEAAARSKWGAGGLTVTVAHTDDEPAPAAAGGAADGAEVPPAPS